MTYYGSRKVVAQFVSEVLKHFGSASLSITITVPEKSEVCCVSIATDTSSADIVLVLARSYSVALLNTSPPITRDG